MGDRSNSDCLVYYKPSQNFAVVKPMTTILYLVNRFYNIKPRATLCVFSHAKVETTSSKGVHCSVSDAR